MEYFLIYLFKASIGILLFYLFYFLVLKKETFYISNRLYLIGGLILAALLPAFPISYTSSIAIDSNASFFKLSENQVGEFLPTVGSTEASSFWWSAPINIISAIYLFGIVFFALRLIIQTASVFIKLRNGKRTLINGVSVVDVSQEIMPFSFFNSVIINIKKYSKDELTNIIAHEKVHIRERHWVDLLIIELLTVVFWINPIVWLYERSIKQNHEYLADQGVLLAGYNPGQYQALLINQLMGVKILGFTNNMNFSLNKKRMEMMKKEKSPEVSKMKLLLALPVIALLVFAFAKKEQTMVDQIAKDLQNTEIKSEKLIKVQGTVQNNNSEPLRGINILIKGTTSGTISNQSGKFIIEAPEDATLVFSFVGYEIQSYKVSELDKSNAVIEMKNASKYYSNEVSGEVIPQQIENTVKVTGIIQNSKSEPLAGVNIILKGTTTGTITDQNGKFIIDAPEDGVLVFYISGYERQVHKISEIDKSNAIIKMK